MRKYLLITLLSIGMILVGCSNTKDQNSTATGGNPIDTSESDIGEINWEADEEQLVVRGDQINLLDGIKAIDSVDGDISDQIEIIDDDNFDTNFVGGYNVTYEVKNSSGITSTFRKDFGVTVAHNVFNGGFDLNYGWTFDIPSGAGSAEIVDGEQVFTINDPGNQWWGIQFYQLNTYFVKGETYKLTFDARSPEGHSISAGFEEVNNNNRMMQYGVHVLKLTEEMQTYELYYTSDANVSNTKTVIYLGWQLPTDNATPDNPHTVIIDNVNVEKVELDDEFDQPTLRGVGSITLASGQHEFDPLEGVTAYDKDSEEINFEVMGEIPSIVRAPSNYVLTYKATDSEGNFRFINRLVMFTLPKGNPYEVINGNFDDGYTGWTREINQVSGSGKATYSEDLENGTVTINITDPSNADHHIQLFQSTSKFTEGETYTITFIAKSNIARKVRLEITDPNNDYENIASPLTCDLTTEYQEFTISVTAEKDFEEVKLGVLLGNVGGNQPQTSSITIDELSVTKN